MRRVIINLLLSVSLVITPMLHAVPSVGGGSGFWESIGVDSVQDSIRGFQEYRGANGEHVYSFGGSLSIKREVASYPAWWSFQAPELSASCSGVSFKGMFGSIINFDEIEKQFSEAGASLAWGILVGIIYSLPGIGEIFSRLDAWSKRIQQMLANACRSGISIGQSIGKEGVSWAGDQLSSMFSDDTTAWYKKVGSGFGDVVDAVDKGLDCAATASEWIAEGNCNTAKSITQNALTRSYFGAPSIMGAAIFNFYYNHNNNFPLKTEPNKIKEFSPENIEAKSGMAGFYDDLALVALITSVTGDSVMSASAYLTVKSAIEKVFSAEDSNNSKQERKAALNSLVNSMKDAEYMCSGYSGNTNMANIIAKYLIYGNSGHVIPGDVNLTNSTSGDSLDTALLSKLHLPNIAVVETKSSPISHAFYATTIYGEVVEGSNFKEIIKEVIKNYKGVYHIAIAARDYYLFGNEEAKSVVTYNLFDDNAQKFMSKVYRNTRDGAEKAQLKDIFINYAVYHMAQAIRTQLSNTMSEYQRRAWEHIPVLSGSTAISGSGSNSGFVGCRDSVIKRFNQFNEELDKVIDGFLKDQLQGVSSPQSLYENFEQQNRKNIKATLEIIKRK